MSTDIFDGLHRLGLCAAHPAPKRDAPAIERSPGRRLSGGRFRARGGPTGPAPIAAGPIYFQLLRR